jgi:hypothetical protein
MQYMFQGYSYVMRNRYWKACVGLDGAYRDLGKPK